MSNAAEMTRRLVAILNADAAGYSRLMAEDETAALGALEAARDIFRQHVGALGGRIIDTAGDSVLAEFASALDAVRAALAIQAGLGQRNHGIAGERRLDFRIGVNLGDVLARPDGTIYGDGVNVAARLQALAEPGGICLSGKVFAEIEGKLDVAFEFGGEHAVKNIARPIPTYRFHPAGAAGPRAAAAAAAPAASSDKPSIAVLPFSNMSGDPDQAYFSDGITEDIITDLSKVSGLFVAARNSSFAYRDRASDLRAVSREVGVRYVLEGSVRKSGNRVRITAQLIDGAQGGHLWAERFDRDLTDIFAVQDEVTREIVAALKVRLTPEENRTIGRRGTENIEAYDLMLRGRAELASLTPAGTQRARALFDQAKALDSRFGAAFAGAAETYIREYSLGWNQNVAATLDKALALLAQALAVDDRSATVHAGLSYARLWKRDFDRAVDSARRAMILDPGSATAHSYGAHVLGFAGHYHEALAAAETVKRLTPHHPGFFEYAIGQCRMGLGEDEAARAALEIATSRMPDFGPSFLFLAALHGLAGRTDQAKACFERLQSLYPVRIDENWLRTVLPIRDPALLERLVRGCKAAGLIDAGGRR